MSYISVKTSSQSKRKFDIACKKRTDVWAQESHLSRLRSFPVSGEAGIVSVRICDCQLIGQRPGSSRDSREVWPG